MSNHQFDAVIIGAGGAGLMCAATAGRRGRRVLLLDHAGQIGRKILISGGGRCNFTNLYASAESYVSGNPHFVKSALARYTPGDFIELVEKHRIPYHEKKLGQLFCDRTAQDIVDMLVSECRGAGVTLWLNCQIKSVRLATGEAADSGVRFELDTTRGAVSSRKLVVATGGLSVPKVGATGYGYELARSFGLKIVKTSPALDGFVFSPRDLERYRDLHGVSADAVVTCKQAAFRENILFTHKGLSGPASLQASLYWHPGEEIVIDLCPETKIDVLLKDERTQGSRQNIKNVLAQWLPKRLAHRFCEEQRLDDSLQHVSDRTIETLRQTLKSWRIKPAGTVGYIKAEVTRGGVDTDELSSRTMECKKVPGLYFIGEVVDVTGQLGGYNFQWAWSSGFAAGENL